ncbi:E3 ubiquitin-protein ligase znrf1 [Phytophthora pseudosyringae]|uniref:E3 ubiquitin-protein ligase znrf1 n=1 Tax=Phytophthora pseudosyringae TaxID=221518 RepID=A0A8T1W6Z3_9STRA|nr:E3 ubiquitin-protein ligase znrf1 [Phytophthora pseudosyringae]
MLSVYAPPPGLAQPPGSSTTEETFLQAEHFVAVVVSRLEKDPLSVSPRLWALQQQATANRLWAFKQQALVGSCDASRGSKTYEEFNPQKNATGLLGFGCCQFVAGGDSKLKMWQKLGDMSAEEAQREYVRVVEDVLPQWQSPPSWDGALLRTWTPDDCSDRCSVCHEAFTFLNRRHHVSFACASSTSSPSCVNVLLSPPGKCRRCLNLVCAVCSPHTVPLRVFSEPTGKRQRVCASCFDEIGEAARRGSLTSSSDQVRVATVPTPTPPEGESSAFGHPTSQDAGNSEASSESALMSSAAIHLGTLEFLQGAYGQGSKVYRKTWHSSFFVLLVRKGSLGMFASQAEHQAGSEPPAAVFKLSGYMLRIRSQPKRPHQFRLTHSSKGGGSPKKPLHFAASSLDEMNGWIAALIKAIAVADELERVATDERLNGNKQTESEAASQE